MASWPDPERTSANWRAEVVAESRVKGDRESELMAQGIGPGTGPKSNGSADEKPRRDQVRFGLRWTARSGDSSRDQEYAEATPSDRAPHEAACP